MNIAIPPLDIGIASLAFIVTVALFFLILGRTQGPL
jgi:hypothetical protein